MAIFFVLFSVAEEIYLCTSQTAAVLLSLLMIVFKVWPWIRGLRGLLENLLLIMH